MAIAPWKHLILPWMCACTLAGAHAQKNVLLQDEATIQERAREALSAQLQPGTKLYGAVVKEKLTGRYTLQISFYNKGEISSVFVIGATGNDLRSQNRFKELVRQLRLPLKTPKGSQYRVEQEFNLDAINH